jgi:hypothetical protein
MVTAPWRSLRREWSLMSYYQLQYVVTRQQSIIQTKVVLLIA